MSLKKYVKTHAPKSLLPFLRQSYYVMLYFFRKRRMLQYLPYYQDELSRKILSDCLKYLRTGDNKIFIDRAEKEGWKFTGLYGVDNSGEYAYGTDSRTKYSDVVVVYDKDNRNLEYARKLMTMIYGPEGFRCVELDEFIRCPRIINSSLIVPAINGRIPASIREDLQYFDVFSPVDDEVVIDAGAYDGTTAVQFLEWGKGKVKKVYSFEFDPVNAAKCEENLKPYADKVTIINKGTWNKDEMIYTNATGGVGSSVSLTGNTAVYLTSIDNVVKDERVTFIKMDVEGAELKSLEGARNTIIKHHPRLAICVYHKMSDLYEIPGYILSLVPEYKFLLRHYCSCNFETVLYAYCD